MAEERGMTAIERETDRTAIVEAVRDYFEGWFEGDAVRMERALHPDLAKRSPEGDGGSPDDETPLDETSASWMVDATARGVGRERAAAAGGDTRVEIRVDDVYDRIASVSVRSAVYHEYLHLVRTRAGWRIANAMWQRTLPAEGAP
jgi:hypothetical protein